MNNPTTETEIPTANSPQVELWLKEKREAVKQKCPESLQPELTAQLDQFEQKDKSATEETLEQQSLELLIKNAQTLQETVNNFIQRMAPLSVSWILKDYLKHFWESFTLDQLKNNKLEKVFKDLREKVEHSEKEETLASETKSEAMSQVEQEVETFLPFYFNSKDRGLIYAEMAKLGNIEAVNQYRQKILKAREKREKYVAKKLQEIWMQKTNPVFGQKTLKLIQKKCGDGVFQLPHVQEAQHFVNSVLEADNKVKNKLHELEGDNASYKDLTGFDHPDYIVLKAANDNLSPPEEATEEKVKEVKESKETQVKSLLEARRLMKYNMNFWGPSDPNLLDDPSFTTASGNRRKALLEKSESLPSLETYEAQEAKSATLAQAQDATKGLWKYRTIDIPANADEFTPDKAQALLSKMSTYTQGGGDMMVAMTGVWYIDQSKRGGAKAKSVSMNNYLAHIDHLLHSLGQPTVTEDDLAQAA